MSKFEDEVLEGLLEELNDYIRNCRKDEVSVVRDEIELIERALAGKDLNKHEENSIERALNYYM